MTFTHDNHTYEFHPIFDGWKLAFLMAAAIDGGEQVLRLESGEVLKLRRADLKHIGRQVVSGGEDGAG